VSCGVPRRWGLRGIDDVSWSYGRWKRFGRSFPVGSVLFVTRHRRALCEGGDEAVALALLRWRTRRSRLLSPVLGGFLIAEGLP